MMRSAGSSAFRGQRRLPVILAWLGLSLVVAMVVVELGVRWLQHRGVLAADRADRLEEAYQASAFREDGLGDAGFLAPGFSGAVKNEFGRPVEWIHNSFGFRTREEITRDRPPGILRILMLGDSFVAGHRLGQEQTVAFRLESWLRGGRHPDAEVLVAAIEEPVIGLNYLESFGLSFEPQIVLLGITLGNDLAQVHFSLAGEHSRYLFTGEPAGGQAPQLIENPMWDQKVQNR